MYRYALLIFFLIGLYSCDSKIDKQDRVLPSSSGKYGEVLVVVDSTYSTTTKTIEQIFNVEVDALPQREPMFRMSMVDSRNFKSILQRGRNILKVTISETANKNIRLKENVWAKDQLVIEITATSDRDAAEILEENTISIRNHFNAKEISRLQAQYAKKGDDKLISIFKKRFNVDITIPPAFVMMDTSGHGLWIKKEKQIGQNEVLQGLLIYELDFNSDTAFNLASMVASRDEFCETHIQGVLEDSYMTVYDEYNPVKEEINLNGTYAVSYRGLWNMKNDFMGGPFIHYVFVDEKRHKIIHAEGFVYAPKFDKREYLRELKAILESIKM